MKNTLLIVTLATLLSACATRPALQKDDPATQQSAKTETAPLKNHTATHAEEEQKAEDPLPAAELSKDLLYKLLSAEIAYQRGEWKPAYVALLSAAQQTRDPRIARRAAEVALSAKQGEETLAAVRLWRTLAPNSEEALQYYLSFLILGDDLSEARPILAQRLQEARPQTRGLLAFQIQRLLARATNKAAAFSLLEELLTPYLDQTEARLALSQGAYALGDAQRARQEARDALQAKPDSELAALALAHATPDKSEATKVLGEFVAHNPKARDVRLAYARMLTEERQYDKARHEFETLLKDRPQDLTLLYALGVLSMQGNDLQAAENYLTNYLALLSTNPQEERDPAQALLLLAQIAEERKDADAALRWLAQIEPGEAYLSAQIKRAQIVAKRGDLAAARRLLHEAQVSGEREQAQIIMAEGQMLRDANQLPEALQVMKAGTDRFPDNADLLYDYAMVAEKDRQWDVMEASLRKLMKIAPANHHAYNALGYSLAERNIRLEEAHALIDKALKLAPNDPFIIDSMGWVQFRLGRLAEAEALLRRAYDLRPDVEIAAHLGEVLWVKGQKEAAQKLWRDAKSRDPQNDTLKSTLARLNVSL